jgi:hypothetical protein
MGWVFATAWVVGVAAVGAADPASRDPEASTGTVSSERQIDFHAGSPYDARQGFAVPHRPDCPAGAVRKGAQPPTGFKEWCELAGKRARIRHGWYAEWHANGRPSVSGEYREGLRVGIWTRWYPSGVKRVQAEFEGGLQNGRLIAWDARGSKLGEERFVKGAPAKE